MQLVAVFFGGAAGFVSRLRRSDRVRLGLVRAAEAATPSR
jgi:hypothetical protein